MTNRWFTRIFGTRFNRELKRIQPIVDAIHEHEARLKEIGDAELQAQTAKFRELIAQRTGAQHTEVERLKQAKHDCPDPEERANLSDQLRKAEQEFVAVARPVEIAERALAGEIAKPWCGQGRQMRIGQVRQCECRHHMHPLPWPVR